MGESVSIALLSGAPDPKPPQAMTTQAAPQTTAAGIIRFQVGTVYWGSLTCAHRPFPVRCVARTEKTVTFEHVNAPEVYKKSRVKAHDCGKSEGAEFRGWWISAWCTKSHGFEPGEI